MASRPDRLPLAAAGLALAILGAQPRVAWPQAWLPPRGEGTVALAYQYFKGGDHLFPTDRIDGMSTLGYTAEGNRWFLGETEAQSLSGAGEYGLSGRVALSGGLTWVTSRYVGRDPADLEVDDGNWNGYLTDLRAGVRYALLADPVALTPLVDVTVPLTDYPNIGHSAPGDGLFEVRAGLAAGWQPGAIPRGFLSGSASYGITEEIESTNLKRLRMDLVLGYFVTDRIPVRLLGHYLHTYDGVEWASDDPSVPITHHGETDVAGLDEGVSASRYLRIGLGAGVPLSGRLGIAASYLATVWGENTDDADQLTVSASWGFQLGGRGTPPAPSLQP